MVLILLIHLINSAVAGAVGSFGCMSLTYLIVTKTNKEMKNYSRVLLHATCINLFNVLVAIIVDPILMVSNGNFYILTGGFLQKSPLQVRFGSILLWAFSILVLNNFLSVLFYYRYIVLCKTNYLTNIRYIVLILVSIGPVLIGIIYLALFIFPADEDFQMAIHILSPVLNNREEIDIGLGYLLSFAQGNFKSFIILIYFFLLFIVNYFVVGYFAIKTWRYMNSTSNQVSSKTRELQVQLFKTLFYQAVTPMATILVPIIFVLIPIILQMDVTLAVIIVTSGLFWAPAINSFMTIWLIKPYRHAILRIFINKTDNQPSDNKSKKIFILTDQK